MPLPEGGPTTPKQVESINDYIVKESVYGDYHVSLIPNKVFNEADNNGIAQVYIDQAREIYEKTKGNTNTVNPAGRDPELQSSGISYPAGDGS